MRGPLNVKFAFIYFAIGGEI